MIKVKFTNIFCPTARFFVGVAMFCANLTWRSCWSAENAVFRFMWDFLQMNKWLGVEDSFQNLRSSFLFSCKDRWKIGLMLSKHALKLVGYVRESTTSWRYVDPWLFEVCGWWIDVWQNPLRSSIGKANSQPYLDLYSIEYHDAVCSWVTWWKFCLFDFAFSL